MVPCSASPTRPSATAPVTCSVRGAAVVKLASATGQALAARAIDAMIIISDPATNIAGA